MRPPMPISPCQSNNACRCGARPTRTVPVASKVPCALSVTSPSAGSDFGSRARVVLCVPRPHVPAHGLARTRMLRPASIALLLLLPDLSPVPAVGSEQQSPRHGQPRARISRATGNAGGRKRTSPVRLTVALSSPTCPRRRPLDLEEARPPVGPSARPRPTRAAMATPSGQQATSLIPGRHGPCMAAGKSCMACRATACYRLPLPLPVTTVDFRDRPALICIHHPCPRRPRDGSQTSKVP